MHVVLVHTRPTDTDATVPAAHTVRSVVCPTEWYRAQEDTADADDWRVPIMVFTGTAIPD